MARLTLTISALSLLAASAAAQTYAVIDWTKVPSCAKQCTVLTSAESACIPPTQAVTSQNAYQACFCSTGTLTGLYANTHAICSDVCTSESDLEKIASWYVNLCTAGVVVTPGVAAGTATATTLATSAAAAGATATGNSPSLSGASDADASTNNWFSNHWKWVVMLIVIFLAMIIGAILGIWLKRRYHRKKDAAGANVAARDGAGAVHPTATATPAVAANAPAMRETSMAGGIGGIAPPRTRALRRPRADTTDTMNSRHSGPVAWGPHQSMAAGYDHANGSASAIPPAPTPVYAGTHDLPDRTYSPVVSRRSSGLMHSRPSTMNIDASVASNNYPVVQEPGSPISPISPADEYVSPVSTPPPERQGLKPIGAQRLREMRSQELAREDASNRSVSSRQSSKRLSKKGSRNAS